MIIGEDNTRLNSIYTVTWSHNIRILNLVVKKRVNKRSKAFLKYDCLWFSNPFTPKIDHHSHQQFYKLCQINVQLFSAWLNIQYYESITDGGIRFRK